MSLEDKNIVYFTLGGSSNSLTLRDDSTLSESASASATTAIIDVTASLTLPQVSIYASCLSQVDGLLSQFEELIYHIAAEQLPEFFALITQHIPPHISSQYVHIIAKDDSIRAHIAERRVDGVMTQTTIINLAADFDRRSLEPYRDQLLATTVLEIRPPKCSRTSEVKLLGAELEMENALKDLFPLVKSVVLLVDSSLYTRYMMQNLGHIDTLKLVYPRPTINDDFEYLRHSVALSLPHFVDLVDLTIPGHLITPEIFFLLGDLERLRVLIATDTEMPLWARLNQDISTKFIALETLEVNCYLDTLLALPYLMKPTSELRSLVIKVPLLQSPMARDTWKRFSHLFPEVEALTITVERMDPDEQRDWFTLADVTTFRHLKRLEVERPSPLEISDCDVKHMLKTWCGLTRLSLSPKPTCFWQFMDRHPLQLPTWRVVERILQKHDIPLKSFSLYLGDMLPHCDTFGMANPHLEKLVLGTMHEDLPLPIIVVESDLIFKKKPIVEVYSVL